MHWVGGRHSVGGMLGNRQRVTDPLEEWRTAARAVARAWYAWLAAERGERRRAHAAYIAALGAEELAAQQVQRRLAGLPSP
jgi:hypothetical protein